MATSDTHDSAIPLIYRVPVLGAIAREWAEGDKDFPFFLVAAVVLAWACAIFVWGLPALYLPAVIAAPGFLLLLVVLTRG